MSEDATDSPPLATEVRPRPERRLWWVLLLLCGVLLSSALLYRAAASGDVRTRNWPAVTGQVISSRVVQAQPGGPGSAPFCFVTVHYAYDVEGKSYTAESNLEKGYNNVTGARAHAAMSYPSGAPVRVHYYPQNPAVSVLAPPEGGFLSFMISLLLWTLAIASTLLAALKLVVPRKGSARQDPGS